MIELSPEERRRAEGLDALGRDAGDYFDRDGDRITMGEWSVLFARGETYRRVGVDEVGKWTVSTVWLGLDHGVRRSLEIFETMVFHEDTDDGDGHLTRRYASEAEARDGHADVVSRLRRANQEES